MNLITLGLVSAFYITLGLASSEATAQLALACIDDSGQVSTIADAENHVVVDDSVPCL